MDVDLSLLAALVGQHQGEQPKPRGVGDRLQQRHHVGGLLAAHRLVRQGCAAGKRVIGERQLAVQGRSRRVRHKARPEAMVALGSLFTAGALDAVPGGLAEVGA